MTVEPGSAAVSDGWLPVGRLQLVEPDRLGTRRVVERRPAHDRLAGDAGPVAGGVAALAVRSWRRPLEATVTQAQALEERRFVLADEPRVPELRRLTRSMNSLVRRLQTVFEQQAATLDELRQQAQADAVTGLLQRRHVVAQLDHALRAEQQRGAGLLLVRLRQLEAINRRIGHDATDRLLAALAQVLQSYPSHVKGALTGRLNGSDFVLYLPAAGMAEETARSLLDALRAALLTVDPEAELAIGGADLPLPCSAADALAMADGALAQAETDGAFAVCIAPAAPAEAPVRGQGEWQLRLTDALQAQRARLDEFEVRNAAGELLHLDCPMRLQLHADCPFEAAPRWLAMAVRCRLVDQADRLALALAIAAIAQDGRPRAVNVAAASLATDGFIAEVRQQLQAAPAAAAKLWVDVAEAAALQPRRLKRGHRCLAGPGRSDRAGACRRKAARVAAAACVGCGLRAHRRQLRAGRGHSVGGARTGTRPGHAAAWHAAAGAGRSGAGRGRSGDAVDTGLRRRHRPGAAPRLISRCRRMQVETAAVAIGEVALQRLAHGAKGELSHGMSSS